MRPTPYKQLHEVLQIAVDGMAEDTGESEGFWFSRENWPAWEYIHDRVPLITDVLRRLISCDSLGDSRALAEDSVIYLIDGVKMIMKGEDGYFKEHDISGHVQELDDMITDAEEEDGL